MEPMLRQLRAASSDIRYDGDLVYLSGTTPDSRRLEAIDIMLELTGGKPESFGGAGAPPPLLLRFSLGETDRRFFTVATLSSPGREHLDYLELGSAARMIWISSHYLKTTFSPPGRATAHIAFMALHSRKK